MAYKVATAANLEDLFTQLVDFVTTDSTLVANGQAWEILRIRRDNILVTQTNLTEPTAANATRRSYHTFRYDCRSLNTDNPSNGSFGHFYAANFVAGTSYVLWHLREAREVKTVRLIAPRASGTNGVNSMLRNFRLQYSDDGISWTTALTVDSSPTYGTGETKDWEVPGAPGTHAYWRILGDLASGNTVTWAGMLLLEADGTVANHFGSEVILKGVGNSGTDNIYVGMRSEYDAHAGWYNLFLNGYTGFDPNEQSWFLQPGALPSYGEAYPLAVPMVPCWNTVMPFWVSASGRSIRFVVKVSTSYEAGYLGFILPYATPGQYPYPLAVGGSLVPTTDARSTEWRYSYVSYLHGAYPGPGGERTMATTGSSSFPPDWLSAWTTLYLRSPDGSWDQYANRPDSYTSPQVDGIEGPSQSSVAPYTPSGRRRAVWPHAVSTRLFSPPYRECLGGGYILQPCILVQNAPYKAVFGELEGTFIISGYENASENTATYGGKTYVIFQNTYRTTVHEFWALSLD